MSFYSSRRSRSALSTRCAAALLILLLSGAASAAGEEARVEFDRDIRPLLAQKCLLCHGPDSSARQADLRLDLESSAKAPRDDGAAVVAGRPQQSGVIRRITSDDESERMPPIDSGVALSQEETERLQRWIVQGAEYQRHWAFREIRRPRVPDVESTSWPVGDVDRFVLARLEAQGLAPASAADRRVLIRRLTFDLIGLAPTVAEVEAFVSDTSPRAYEKVVDRLLASPHFGERWGRHWLDLVRYAETYGYEHDWPIPLAWRYRDYVIRMFNADVPYDQIVREHIAGDLLENPRRHAIEGYRESIIGTGFWYLHGQMSQPVDVRKHEADRFDNQIDVFSRAMLGLTVACARCHDHKFDPISTKDYYGLLGLLRSSRRQEAYLDPHGGIAESVAKLTVLRREADALLAGHEADARYETASGEAAIGRDVEAGEESEQLAGTVLFADFTGATYGDWFVSGQAFGAAPTQPRQWDRASGAAVSIRPALAHSGMLAGKLQGTLESPEFTITHPHIWLRVAGKGTIRIVINGYMMQRYKDQLFRGTQIKLDIPEDELRWVELAGELSLYLGHTAYLEIVDNSDGTLVVDEIRFAKGPPPQHVQAIRGPSQGTAALDARLAEIAGRMAELDRGLPLPKRALAMSDGNAIDARVKIRGDVRQLGAQVPRGLPEVIRGRAARAKTPTDGSGRRMLAEQLLDPANPLLARVRVNWVWHHLFGRGIVPSVDNFGVLGERPSHPALLDYLADRFRMPTDESTSGSPGFGWSVKRLIREIVLSRTYRMSTRPQSESAQRLDPDNRLLHRMRIRRLEGEAIRDAMLSVSGQLNPSRFGPAVPVHLTPFMQGLSRPEKSGPLDGHGRRSIYLEVRRNFLPPMFVTFDMPLPATCVARRSNSNVPAQALILMNDPFVAQQARAWAERVVEETSEPSARIEQFYLEALARPPRPDEAARAQEFLQQQATAYGVSPEEMGDHLPLWTDLAHALFGVKEFVFIR
ncbi:MAG: DUF1549 domain-containing protein [Planctomycetota bacterium]|nr:MAG: DUF1549 domain-containing protein [Planctomycetota bacterium]